MYKRQACQQKAREAQKNVREFIGEHKDVLRRDYWREKTYGIPLEDSQKDAILNAEIKRESGIRGVLHLDPEPLEDVYKRQGYHAGAGFSGCGG